MPERLCVSCKKKPAKVGSHCLACATRDGSVFAPQPIELVESNV
jgi:hypothetical protein